jgi:murein DD-endopeptidase MepM/ murein hydrolase activator NlpD
MTKVFKNLKLNLALLLLGLVSTLGLTMIGAELSLISLVPQSNVKNEKGEATLEKAVEKAARLDGAPSTPKVFNEVKRKNITDDWAFGSISISDPSEEGRPWTKLWLAQKTKNGWVAATDFTPTFIAWVKQAPQDIINQEERKILGSNSPQFGGILPAKAGDTSGNFSFPWKPGDSWNLNSGPHGQSRGTTPWNSLDLAGGDQKVLAATGGLFYKACSGAQVQIRQPNGWTTTYFHLTNTAQIKDGTSIQRGTYLGNTGETTGSCPGSAKGRHVHFSISLNGVKQSWNGREISGWTIYDGKKEYEGRAEKDGKVVYASEYAGKALLYNPKYAIVNNASYRCLDVSEAKVTNDGTPIHIWDCHHGVAQQWKFVNNQIRNIEGKCLDVINDGKDYGNGSKVVLWTCHQGNNQKWSLNRDGTISGIGGKCLDAANDGKNYGNGSQIVLWQCHGRVNQQWRKVD